MTDDVGILLSRSDRSRERHAAGIRGVRAVERKAERDIRVLENRMVAESDLSRDVGSVVHTFRAVTADPTLIPHALLAKYLEIVPRAVANLGSGSDLTKHDEVSVAIRAAIARCESDGLPVSDLYLSLARFLSYSTLETRERERAIRAAISTADTVESRLRSVYALAWYLVEVSEYRKAVDVCQSAMNDAGAEAGYEAWRLSFVTMEAVAKYTTLNAPAEVHDLLTSVLPQFAATEWRSQDVDLAYSEALHYLGRCELDLGDTESALRLFVQSHQIKERHPYESRAIAYYHIRIAEALIGGSNLTHAADHLRLANEFLNRVADSSAGRVNYDIARSSLMMEQNDRQGAAELLDLTARTAKQQRYARGYLLALGRLFVVRWTSRELGAAVIVLLRAIPILFSGELRRNSLLAILANFGRYSLLVFRPYRRDGGRVTGSPAGDCPCPHHANTVAN